MSTLVLLLVLFGEPETFTLEGKVIGIKDGDTIKILVEKRQIDICLLSIDTPEKSQPMGKVAKQVLSGKVFGKQVKVLWREKDMFGRTLGNVYIDKRWINKEIIAEGYAWHYKKYSHNESLAAAENDAQAKKLGVWPTPNPKAPWQYRNEKRAAAAAKKKAA